MKNKNRSVEGRYMMGKKQSRHAGEEFGPGSVEFVVCSEGGEAYFHKSWHHALSDFKHLGEKKKLSFKLCPFHQMVKNKQYEGELIVENVPVKDHSELVRLIEKSGEHGYRADPMDRIIKIESKGNAIRVELSENQLTQKIANKIRDRFKKTTRKVSRGKDNSDLVRIKVTFS
ncbi:MAG: hypothetical protein Q7R91_01990 [bacterium]|nr:hypothetical protein [bacterium]